MSNFKLDLKGLDEVERKFKGLESRALNRLEAAMRRGLLAIHQNIPPYPAGRGERAGFKTARQRRWFFAALRSGQIKSPYKRTMTLGRSITTFKGGATGALSEVTRTGPTVRGVIGTAIPYAQYVVGPKQAKIHQGRWWLLIAEVKKNLTRLTRIMQAEIDQMIKED